jgi:hypothetical protein
VQNGAICHYATSAVDQLQMNDVLQASGKLHTARVVACCPTETTKKADLL